MSLASWYKETAENKYLRYKVYEKDRTGATVPLIL